MYSLTSEKAVQLYPMLKATTLQGCLLLAMNSAEVLISFAFTTVRQRLEDVPFCDFFHNWPYVKYDRVFGTGYGEISTAFTTMTLIRRAFPFFGW